MTINNFKKLIPPSLGAVLSVDAPEPLWRAHADGGGADIYREPVAPGSILLSKIIVTDIEVRTAGRTMTWYDARRYARNLGSGWRLPYTTELILLSEDLRRALGDVDVWSNESSGVEGAYAVNPRDKIAFFFKKEEAKAVVFVCCSYKTPSQEKTP